MLLSEADCDKLKGAFCRPWRRCLAPARHTEKTNAVLEQPATPETGEGTQPGFQRFPATCNGIAR